MKPLLLLHVITSSNPRGGGPIEGLRQLYFEFSKLGIVMEVLTTDAPDAAWSANTPFKCYAMGPSVLRYSYTPKLKDWLKINADRYDGIIINGIWQYGSYAVWRALKGKKKPYFIFPHGMLDPWFKSTYPLKHIKKYIYWLFAEYWVIRNANTVFFTCQTELLLARESFWPYHANELVTGYGTSYPPTDSKRLKELFLSKFPELRAKKILLFLGRIHVKKGCDLLIEAFSKIAYSNKDLQLFIAGPCEGSLQAELMQMAAKLFIADRVTWAGMLIGDDKWGAFYASDVFCLPSHQENFGIVVAEALACGKPVIISNKVNIWKEIQEDGAGIIHEDTLDGTTQGLEEWLSLGEDEKERMRLAALSSFKARFHIGTAAKNIVNHIQSITPIREFPSDQDSSNTITLEASMSKPLQGGASFSLANRIHRAIWNCSWIFLASWTPPLFHPWRRFLLRLFGAKMGRMSDVRGSARVWFPPFLEMHDHALIAERVTCYNQAKIILFEGALVSQGANLCAGSHDVDDLNFQLVAKAITIGKRAWIASEAFIGPGVAIGEFSVVGARAVIFSSIGDAKIYVGNPAKFKRMRLLKK